MNSGVRNVLVAGLFVLLAGYRANADSVFPGAEWHHIPASEAGWSEAALTVAHERANALQ